MEWLLEMLDLLIHFDKHLLSFIESYGTLVYVLLFAIIFSETGFIIFPFLPGDSLLFVLGTLSARDILSLPVVLISLSIAAIIGDMVNFHLGYYFHERLVALLKRIGILHERGYRMAQQFYAERGGMAVVTARFLPLLRTFVPFVAGVAKMDRSQFIIYNIGGGIFWVVGVTLLGYIFGSLPIPWMQDPDNLKYIFLLLVIIPGMIAILGAFRFWKQDKSRAAKRSER